MSLLVHELLIGTGGGRGAGTNLKTSPSSPVPIVSIPVSSTNSSIHVTQLQSNRVVTITSAQNRSIANDKGSRLAEALAGNSSYSYSNTYQLPRNCQFSQRQHVSHVNSPSISSSQLTQVQFLKSVSRQSYILPFVLQDHNYGAPPPSTPPQSPPPPPLTISSPVPIGYKIQQIVSPSKGNIPNLRNNTFATFTSSPSKSSSHCRKVISEQSILTLNNIGAVQIAATSDGNIVTNCNSTVTSHILASMPLPRQQFMPHPKAPLFSSPHVPSNKIENIHNQNLTSPNGGVDTDEESRLSDQSSSAGPSGEETETAPEGEGEEVQADDSITRCICNFTHDDGYMIQCDRCFVWQHVDCMAIDRDNIPDEYLCEACLPRPTDRYKARALQVKRRQEIKMQLNRASSSESDDNVSLKPKPFLMTAKVVDRKVLKKKKTKSLKENRSSRRNSGSSKTISTNAQNKTPSSNPTQKTNANTFVSKGPAIEDKDSKLSIKSKRRQSISNNCALSGDESSNLSLNIDQLRSWIEDYEIAVTNHYSQELRARVHTARINGISQEFRESTQGAMLGHRCRVAPSYDVKAETFEHKVLVATTRLSIGTAIIEYQGKYTLQSQWNSVQVPAGLSYLPFVLQYNMQKEGLHICVDARTYGNDARFARRCINYNSEIHHVVERGSVHLYIVACKDIEEEEEIILPLETAICSPSLVTKPVQQESPSQPVVEPKIEVKEDVIVEVAKPTPTLASPIRKNGTLQSKKCSRKPLLTLALPQPLNRTNRRSTSGDNSNEEPPNTLSQIELPPVKQRRVSGCGGPKSPVKSPVKSPCKSPAKVAAIEDRVSGETPPVNSPSGDKSECHKMTREERKIAAYIKAFERMEKAAQRRQEIEKRRGDGNERKQSEGQEDDDYDEETSKSPDENLKADKGRKTRKKSGKGSPHKTINDFEDLLSDGNCSSSEGERIKNSDVNVMGYSSPPSGSGNQTGFRFPKTKKALMNEWLNETVDPVLHSTLGDLSSGVPTCYMRSPYTPSRKSAGIVGSSGLSNGTVGIAVAEMAGRSAKKRWLRQAIIDETEPQNTGFSFCSSPNSRPDSPTSGDYITPLKKRRLARESMSSEQSNTPPSTPAHSSMEEKFKEEMENNRILPESMELSEENFNNENYFKMKTEKDELHETKIKNEEDFNVKKENSGYNDYADSVKDEKLLNPSMCKDSVLENNNVYDQLTINISQLGKTVKTEKESETMSEINITSRKVYSKRKDKSLEFNVKFPRKTQNTKSVCSSITKRKREKCKRSYGTSHTIDRKRFTKISTKIKRELRNSPSCKIKNKSSDKLSDLKNLLLPPKIKKKLSLHDCNRESDKKTLNSISSDNLCLDPAVVSDKQNCTTTKVSKDVTSEVSLCKATKDISDTLCTSSLQINKGSKETVTDFHVEDDVSVAQEGKDSLLVVEQSMKLNSNVPFPEDQMLDTKKKVSGKISKFPPADKVKPNNSSIELKPVDEKEEDSIEMVAEDHMKNVIEDTSKTLSLSGMDAIVPIKKKLSILEYRKRKSISCDSDSKEDISKSIERPGSRSMSLDSESNCKKINPSKLEERNELITSSKAFETPLSLSMPPRISLSLDEQICSPPSPLSPSILDDIKMSDQSQELVNSPPKWNAAPTLLEQQRETLTARLRKNFGFCIPEKNNDHFAMSEKSIEEKLADIEKRMSLSEKLKLQATAVSLSVAPPSFPSHVSAMSVIQVSDPLIEAESSSIKAPASGILRPLTFSLEGGAEDFPKPSLYGPIGFGEICKDVAIVKNIPSPLSCENTTLLLHSPKETLVETLVPSNKLIHPDFCKSSDL